MILFFHLLCLLARYIVSNISKSISKRKTQSDEENEDDSVVSNSSDYVENAKGYNKQPVYEDGTLKFFPPVYVQRYETVALILKDSSLKEKIKKVVDFGCAELGFFMYLKNIEGVNEVLEVDIDVDLLERYSFKAAPLTSDYLMNKCKKPLDVYILAGSIADYDDCLLGTDVVIAIELIEHLSEEAFNKMPYNIFHQIKPKLAIFTTPNAEFNTLFPNFNNIRHSDHKFEWTRKEFYEWTQAILSQYQEYSVRFYGIGAGPDGTENLGCCSQMAVFQRADDIEPFSSAREEFSGIHNYKLIKHFKYPVYVDTRTNEEKIIHEIQYQMSHFNATPNYYNYDEDETEIPLSFLEEYVSELCHDNEELRNILKKNGLKLRMKNDAWYLVYNESDLYSSDGSIGDEDWLNEEITSTPKDKGDAVFDDKWDWNEDQLNLDEITNYQSARSADELIGEGVEKSKGDYVQTECLKVAKDATVSAPEGCNQLLKQLESPNNLAVSRRNKNEEIRQINLTRSKIPRRVEDESRSGDNKQPSYASYVCRKISKSCSLDSCLENINCKPFEFDSFYLNLMPGSVPYRNVSSLSCKKNKHDSGSSLLSSSLEKAADSGYPISFSPPDADLTPEQVDELFTENEMMSRSTSESSEVENVEMIHPRLHHHDLFVEEIVVENGDLANNNRDGEGNNVEGLMGERLVNERAAARDPNDNMFFPEIEEFPPWLLNLGELALRPLFIPLEL